MSWHKGWKIRENESQIWFSKVKGESPDSPSHFPLPLIWAAFGAFEAFEVARESLEIVGRVRSSHMTTNQCLTFHGLEQII